MKKIVDFVSGLAVFMAGVYCIAYAISQDQALAIVVSSGAAFVVLGFMLMLVVIRS